MSENITNLEKEYLAIKRKYLQKKRGLRSGGGGKVEGGDSTSNLEREFTTKVWQKRYHDMRRKYNNQIDKMDGGGDYWKNKARLAKDEYLNIKYDGNEIAWEDKYRVAKREYLELKGELSE